MICSGLYYQYVGATRPGGKYIDFTNGTHITLEGVATTNIEDNLYRIENPKLALGNLTMTLNFPDTASTGVFVYITDSQVRWQRRRWNR